jgi:hypothetical protein
VVLDYVVKHVLVVDVRHLSIHIFDFTCHCDRNIYTRFEDACTDGIETNTYLPKSTLVMVGKLPLVDVYSDSTVFPLATSAYKIAMIVEGEISCYCW